MPVKVSSPLLSFLGIGEKDLVAIQVDDNITSVQALRVNITRVPSELPLLIEQRKCPPLARQPQKHSHAPRWRSEGVMRRCSRSRSRSSRRRTRKGSPLNNLIPRRLCSLLGGVLAVVIPSHGVVKVAPVGPHRTHGASDARS